MTKSVRLGHDEGSNITAKTVHHCTPACVIKLEVDQHRKKSTSVTFKDKNFFNFIGFFGGEGLPPTPRRFAPSNGDLGFFLN